LVREKKKLGNECRLADAKKKNLFKKRGSGTFTQEGGVSELRKEEKHNNGGGKNIWGEPFRTGLCTRRKNTGRDWRKFERGGLASSRRVIIPGGRFTGEYCRRWTGLEKGPGLRNFEVNRRKKAIILRKGTEARKRSRNLGGGEGAEGYRKRAYLLYGVTSVGMVIFKASKHARQVKVGAYASGKGGSEKRSKKVPSCSKP